MKRNRRQMDGVKKELAQLYTQKVREGDGGVEGRREWTKVE